MVKKKSKARQRAGRRASSKGGGGERYVCRAITKWVTGKEKPEIVWRSAMSGGKATLDGVYGHTMAGDIVAIDPRAFFFTDRAVVDAKDRKNANALDFLKQTEKELNCIKISKGEKGKGKELWVNNVWCWWVKLYKEAMEAEKIPMLMFKRPKSRFWYLVMRTDDINKLIVTQEPKSVPALPSIMVRVLSARSMRGRVTIVRLDHFFDRFTEEEFFKAFPLRSVVRLKRIRRANNE